LTDDVIAVGIVDPDPPTTTGNLRDFGVVDLLYLLALRRQTGRLTIRTPSISATLSLVDGRLAMVRSSDPALRLGQVLIGAGCLGARRLRTALRQQARIPEPLPLGRILLTRGWLSEDDLARGLEAQSVAILARLIAAETGAFAYRRDAVPPAQVASAPLATDRLILEAIRRADELRLAPDAGANAIAAD
jgi:hypothetical protein